MRRLWRVPAKETRSDDLDATMMQGYPLSNEREDGRQKYISSLPDLPKC